MASIYLIRHGQAGFGQKNYDVLTELGIKQAQHLGKHFAQLNLQPDVIVAGNMVRHQLTKEHAISQLPNLSDTVEFYSSAHWNEFNHEEVLSVFDKTFAEPEALMAKLSTHPNPKKYFIEQFSQAVQRWMSGDYNHEYSETWQAFNERVNLGLTQLVEQLEPKQKAVVFTSGGVISTIMMKQMQIPHTQLLKLNMNIANASVTELKVNQFGTLVHKFNDYSAMTLAGETSLVTFK